MPENDEMQHDEGSYKTFDDVPAYAVQNATAPWFNANPVGQPIESNYVPPIEPANRLKRMPTYFENDPIKLFCLGIIAGSRDAEMAEQNNGGA